MTKRPATVPGANNDFPARFGRRLRRTALGVALAAAGLASTNASAALADICTTASTTVSVSNTAASDEFCNLSTGQSLVVNATITFNASTSSSQLPAVLANGDPAGSIDNSGTIYSSDGESVRLATTSTLGSGINNRAGATIDGAEGVTVESGAALQNGIVNDGTITAHGTQDCEGIRVFATGQITGGIVNRGAITGCAGANGISNFGSIDAIDNLQGGGTPLTLRGIVPTAYRIIVGSTASYGSLQAFGPPTGTMTFNIHPDSTLAVHTYPDVLVGVAAARLTGPLSGTFGGLAWQLVLANEGNGVWDLVVTSLQPPIVAAQPVPAMPAWGGALLAALLGGFGAAGLRRRRQE